MVIIFPYEVVCIGFEMQVVSNTPLVGEDDPDIVAKTFFEQIGYLSKGSDPDIPYKLFNDFFLNMAERLGSPAHPLLCTSREPVRYPCQLLRHP